MKRQRITTISEAVEQPLKIRTKQINPIKSFKQDEWKLCKNCHEIFHNSFCMCRCKTLGNTPILVSCNLHYAYFHAGRLRSLYTLLDTPMPQKMSDTYKFMEISKIPLALHMIQTILCESHPLTQELMNLIHSYYYPIFTIKFQGFVEREVEKK